MVFIVFPVLTIMSPPSSRFHSIFGSGYPRALHTNLAEPPSGIIMSPDVSSYTMSGGMTTSRKALCGHKRSFRGQKGRNPQKKYNFRQAKSGRRGQTNVWCYLALHRVRVHLAHIRAPVFSPDGPDVQRPRVVIIVCDRQSFVVGNHVFMDGQYGFRIGFDPSHLNIGNHKYILGKRGNVIDYNHKYA